MRIMHVMAGAVEGGAENIMLESVCALAEAGLEQYVITRPNNQFRLDTFASAGIGYATCRFNLRWPFSTRKKIREAIERFRPDVIEYWMGRAGQFGYHTAILGVNVDLGIECVRQQAPLGVIQRHPGLITAGFYAQYLHCFLA